MISNTFRGLDKTYQDLMMLTPQQLADVSRRSQAGDPNAPPSFLIVAALDAQNKAQQRQMQPPTQTVAEDVIAQAAQNQYQNRLAESGVAALPTARPMTYEGGGLVSFEDGGQVPESTIQAIHKKYPFMSEEDIRKGLETVFKPTESMLERGYTAPSDDLTAAPAAPSDVSTTPEPEPTFADYLKMTGMPSGAGIPKPPSTEKMIEQYRGAVEELPVLTEETTIEGQIAENRKAMRAAGIDPEAELQRQVGLTNKRRKEIEAYKEKGKGDILLQLGAAMMAGRSPHALVNIGEALKNTVPAIQEYRNAIDKRNELADEAEELARQVAYKQKVGDYEGAKKDVEDRKLKNHEIKIATADARNKAAIAALTERGALLRTQLTEIGANTRQAQDTALKMMELDRQTKTAQSKLEQEYNLAALKNLDLDSISDKDLTTVYKNVQESNGFSNYMEAWKNAHVVATPEQVSAAQDKFVRDRINEYMRLRNEVVLGQSALNSYYQKAALGGSGITSLSPR